MHLAVNHIDVLVQHAAPKYCQIRAVALHYRAARAQSLTVSVAALSHMERQACDGQCTVRPFNHAGVRAVRWQRRKRHNAVLCNHSAAPQFGGWRASLPTDFGSS